MAPMCGTESSNSLKGCYQRQRPGLFRSGLEVLTTAARPGLSAYHKPGTVLSAFTCISYPGSGPPHWPQPQRANLGNSDRVQLTLQLRQHLSIPAPKYSPWASRFATPFLENALTQREPEQLLQNEQTRKGGWPDSPGSCRTEPT